MFWKRYAAQGPLSLFHQKNKNCEGKYIYPGHIYLTKFVSGRSRHCLTQSSTLSLILNAADLAAASPTLIFSDW
jgi:hypothetical protein